MRRTGRTGCGLGSRYWVLGAKPQGEHLRQQQWGTGSSRGGQSKQPRSLAWRRLAGLDPRDAGVGQLIDMEPGQGSVWGVSSPVAGGSGRQAEDEVRIMPGFILQRLPAS